jgi:hypothetical protein
VAYKNYDLFKKGALTKNLEGTNKIAENYKALITPA